MTLQTGNLRRAAQGVLASSAMAIGLLIGIGSATAHADVRDDVGAKYMEGAGGGQISNYVKQALQLRALGFRPSKSNMDDLQKGWDYLPNQSRLVDALKETIAYQHRMQELQLNQVKPNQPPGYNPFGAGQAPPGMSPLPPGIPGATIDQPVG
ncbi:MAG: hypothetical protein NVS4B6_19240 [Mycobacterium sp.]